MNKENRGILVGMVLGDGYLRKVSRNTSCIIIKHSYEQYEYLDYKAELLSKVFKCKKPAIRIIDNNGYKGAILFKGHRYLDILRKWIYIGGKKTYSRKILNYLTPQGIALWYMDDGSLIAKKRDGKIHAFEMYLSTYTTKEENQVIIDYFKEVWDVNFTQTKNKGKYRLRCGTKEFRKFREIIEPYIIPSMRYKIDMYRG